MKAKNLIVFDMDGVIIDVSRSYRDTVRQTARLFFKGAIGWEKLPDILFPLSDLAIVKQSGGLNNDWDLTFLVINLLFSFAKISTTANDAKTNAWDRYKNAITGIDVIGLAEFLQSETRPLITLLKEKGNHKYPFITGCYTGDVGSGNIIKQIFQEIYLGKDLFESTYGMPTKMYHEEGCINRETLLIDPLILESLSKANILAIATGRPGAEAAYPLNYFGLSKYFTIIYTLDDCIREEKRIWKKNGKKVSLSKPHPFMLDAIYDLKKHGVSGLYYIGDMPDDMVAASTSNAGFKGVGFLLSAPDRDNLKEVLLQAGADYIVEDIEEVKELIEGGKMAS